ncbi:hypothetical protein ACQ4PT_015562 [Festuca glaucescens]
MADVYGCSSPAMAADAEVDDDSSPAKPGLVKSEGEIYMESLVGASLLLVSKEFPLEHLVDHRSGQLSGGQLLNLKIQLVGSPSGKAVSVYSAANTGKSKGRNGSLLMLAAKNILRAEFGRNGDESAVESTTISSPTFLSSVKSAPVFEDERVGFSLVLDPYFISSPTSSLSPILPKSLRQPSVSEDERIHVSNESNNIICVLSSENGTSSSPEKSDRSSTSSSSESGKMSQNSNSSDTSSTASSSQSGKRSQNSNISMSHLDNDKTMLLQRNDRHLLTEHNLLCEAFSIATSFLGIVQYTRIIPCLLDPLNKIWSRVEWKYLSREGLLFSDDQFLKMAYHVVKFVEEQLKKRKTEESGACDPFSIALIQQILPLILQLLHCVHGLWNQDDDFLPEELKRAKCLSCVELASTLASTNGLYAIDNEEYLLKNKTVALLEGTRQRVYNVLGLCTSIEGAFSELLDSQTVRNTLSKDLGSMELRHLGKVIRLVVIPLVENCPCQFWEPWRLVLIGPILVECEYRLHYAWFDLLYQGGTGKPYFYGNLVGSAKHIKELKLKLLLAFTREVSDLLRALALTKQNMESVSSSLLRFLLGHDCFRRMRMSLFGYFVDDETTMKAVPFCHSLTWLAINDMSVRHLILNDLLPCLIQRLDNQLPCAIQRLRRKLGSSTKASSKDLEALCEEWYNHFDSAGEDKGDAFAENNFTAWLTKKKEDLQVKAHSAAKKLSDGSDWNWEFEDEFRRFLPAYMDILQEVDSINDDEEVVFLDQEWLFQKLKPEFRSKYGMNSCEHHYMSTIFSVWRRKDSMACIMVNRNKGKFVSELIKLKPYIKASDSSSTILSRLKEKSEIAVGLPDFAVKPSLSVSVFCDYTFSENLGVFCMKIGQTIFALFQYLRGVLLRWEPVFHPLIRESHMSLLLKVVDQYTKWNESKWCQQIEPDASDFESHLQPYADTCFKATCKEKKYYIAKEQICLHKKFDSYLASGVLDIRMDMFKTSKDDFVKDLVQNEMARMQLSDLHDELMNLSLERRYELVKIQQQVLTYVECLQRLLNNDSLKDELKVLMEEVERLGFFDTDNDSVDWENKLFTELIVKFSNQVFAKRVPRHYVIRGIIDYRKILLCKDSSQQVAFQAVVDEKCERWIESREEFWEKTSHYDHLYYDIVRRPLEQVFTQ